MFLQRYGHTGGSVNVQYVSTGKLALKQSINQKSRINEPTVDINWAHNRMSLKVFDVHTSN